MNKEIESTYYKETARRYDEQLEKNIHNPSVLCWKGYSLFNLYKQNKDIKLLNEARSFVYLSLVENIMNPDAWNVMSNIYERMGKFRMSKKCIACYETIVRKNKGQKKRLVKILKRNTDSVLWENQSQQKALPEGNPIEV